MKAGNIRETDLIEVYRTAPVFRELRDRTAGALAVLLRSLAQKQSVV